MTEDKYSHLMIDRDNPSEAFERLREIVNILRSECPWDREQTHESIRVCMIEEAYEVADSIDTGDMDNMREELGDVLLQVIFHAMMANEENHFDISDVINEECNKMIRRHPHVFGDNNIKTVDKVLEKWENIKRKEHKNESHTDRLLDVPRALPALTRAEKVQKRAAEVGFDWDDVRGAFEKITEETEELISAYQSNKESNVEEELGDLLFAVVNAARFLGIEPETALTRASDKFTKRFGAIDAKAKEQGSDLSEMTLDEMDELWEAVKNEENL